MGNVMATSQGLGQENKRETCHAETLLPLCTEATLAKSCPCVEDTEASSRDHPCSSSAQNAKLK